MENELILDWSGKIDAKFILDVNTIIDETIKHSPKDNSKTLDERRAEEFENIYKLIAKEDKGFNQTMEQFQGDFYTFEANMFSDSDKDETDAYLKDDTTSKLKHEAKKRRLSNKLSALKNTKNYKISQLESWKDQDWSIPLPGNNQVNIIHSGHIGHGNLKPPLDLEEFANNYTSYGEAIDKYKEVKYSQEPWEYMYDKLISPIFGYGSSDRRYSLSAPFQGLDLRDYESDPTIANLQKKALKASSDMHRDYNALNNYAKENYMDIIITQARARKLEREIQDLNKLDPLYGIESNLDKNLEVSDIEQLVKTLEAFK
tara:strand:- start:233 stop:1180 length:948 start_codon:yes stop_codon:yes gene_type:complete